MPEKAKSYTHIM